MKFKRVLILLLVLDIFTVYAAYSEKPGDADDCVTKVELREVRGHSLAPLVNAGSTVKLLYGYYNCHPIKRKDIIAYKYAGNDVPVIKIVKAIPGDRFHLQKANNGWYILINGRVAKNSLNQPYISDERGYDILSGYEKRYQGVIPQDACLIFCNAAGCFLDSRRFGLIEKQDILARVEKISQKPLDVLPNHNRKSKIES